MQLFQIQINGQPVQLGAPLPASITSFAVNIFMPVQIPSEQSAQLRQWLNNIIEHLDCTHVSYNHVLIPTSDLQKL